MSLADKVKSIDRDFLAGEAGSISGLATRTISSWCEKGVLVSPTAGRGDRRRFSVLQLVEIGIIRKLSEAGIPLATIKDVMGFIRRELDYGLTLETFHVVIPSTNRQGEPNRMWVFNWQEVKGKKDKNDLLKNLLGTSSDRVQIFNLSLIAKEVLDRI